MSVLKKYITLFNSIRHRMLILLVGIALMIGGVFYLFLKYSFDYYISVLVVENLKDAKDMFAQYQQSEVDKLSTSLSLIQNNKEYTEHFKERNRDSLYARTKTLYEHLSEKQDITQLNYFMPEPQMVCFLRVQSPKLYGDLITRFVLQNTIKNKEETSGIELGKTGFSLRVVQPYFSGEVLLGYIEMGCEIGHFLKKMKGKGNDEYGILINKNFVNKGVWDFLSTQKTIKRWTEKDDWLLVERTSRFDFPESTPDIQKNNKGIISSGLIQKNNRYFSTGFFPVYDASNQIFSYISVYHDITDIYQQFQYSRIIILSLLTLLLGISFIILLRTTRHITDEIDELTQIIDKISLGNIVDFEVKRKDEIGQMQKTLARLCTGLRKHAEFAQQIGNLNLDVDFQTLSKEDTLGNSLLEMRERLATIRDEEYKRKEEEDKNDWLTESLNHFGDLLRQNYTDIHDFGYIVIKNLIELIGMNQGGFFILNDEDKFDVHFELIASYAYDRRRFVTKKIELTEGLIGACALEKQTIYMTKLPNEYIELTSGLGTANPNCLLLVPLKTDEKVMGVIELASFKLLDPHQILFVEKLGINIASTLANTKSNENTKKLLELLKHQADEQASQEEELRQNLEELETTQESNHKLQEEAAEKEQRLQVEIKHLKLEIEHLKAKTKNNLQ